MYPSKRVTEIQELQLTRVKKNVKTIEVSGTFDDCQKLVKMAFSDKKLRNNVNLTSANSINIGRLIPQITYYIWAKNKLNESSNPIFCVPSGNLGNLTGGILAKLSGIKINDIKKLINEKRVIYDYKVDQKEFKWSGKSILKKIDLSFLPNYISKNEKTFKEWLD